MRKSKLFLLVSCLLVFFGSVGIVAFSAGNKAEAAAQTCLTKAASKPQVSVSGNKATATFTIPEKCKSEKVTLASYEAPNGTDGKPYNKQKLFRWVTTTYKPGKHTLKVTIPSCYYQVDLAGGDVIHQFSAGNTYAQQGRLLDSAHGGNKSCEPPKPAPKPPKTVVVVPKQQDLECTLLRATLTSSSGSVPATYQFAPTVDGQSTNALTYNYDFGDGNTMQVSSPTTSHTYQQPGTYNVSLSITSADMKTGSNVNCNTSVVVSQTPVSETPPPETPAPAQPVVAEGKSLPDTGPGDYAAIGAIWAFMGSMLFAYRGRYEDIVQAFVSRLG